MKYSSLGSTGIDVSRLGFGLWTLSMKGWDVGNQVQSKNLLREAFDLGVTLFDTSDRFGNGFGEDLIGGLAADLRHQIVISTRGGFDFYPRTFGQEKESKNLSFDYLIYACEQSLKRLKTDYIDIYMIDYPKLRDVENDESFEAVDKLKEDGKILAWGASLDFSDEMDEVVEILIRDRGVEVLHIPHNPMETDFLDKISDLINQYSTGIFTRRTHCYGLLDGTLDFEEIRDLNESGMEMLNPGLKRVVTNDDGLPDIGHQGGDFKAHALEFSLNNNQVTSVLPNILNYEDLVRYADISA